MPQSSRRLRERRNACAVVVSGMRFESFFFLRTATHVRARESEGTACVVVVSDMRFESFLLFVFFCTYSHARTATRARTSS